MRKWNPSRRPLSPCGSVEYKEQQDSCEREDYYHRRPRHRVEAVQKQDATPRGDDHESGWNRNKRRQRPFDLHFRYQPGEYVSTSSHDRNHRSTRSFHSPLESYSPQFCPLREHPDYQRPVYHRDGVSSPLSRPFYGTQGECGGNGRSLVKLQTPLGALPDKRRRTERAFETFHSEHNRDEREIFGRHIGEREVPMRPWRPIKWSSIRDSQYRRGPPWSHRGTPETHPVLMEKCSDYRRNNFTRSQRPRYYGFHKTRRREIRLDEHYRPSSRLSGSDLPRKSSEEHTHRVEHIIWRPGMRLLPHLEVTDELGEGTFGKVLGCRDYHRHRDVAVKVVRAGTNYADAALFEAEILRVIAEKDVEGNSGCVDFYDWFIFEQKHVCIVTERLGMSLYDFLAKNRFRGFSLEDIQVISRDVLRCLAFFRAIGLTHTDLKPENVLLIEDKPISGFHRSQSEEFSSTKSSSSLSMSKKAESTWRTFMRPRRANVKIIDFGSATFAEDEHSSLINTRQYRAPEVILDLGWNEASDLWSLGCVLVELYTGQLLFRTHEHMEHLAMMERIIGPIPWRMLEHARHTGGGKFIDRNLRLAWPANASSAESIGKVDRLDSLEQQLACSATTSFTQFVREMLVIDPHLRQSPVALLRHPFLRQTFSSPGILP